VSDPRPARGGAWDFRGRLTPDYSPSRDGDPDPGEVVWVWVPFEEDAGQGKDRPVVVIGRDTGDDAVLVALMLSSKDHDDDRDWLAIGAGGWDPQQRPSWVRLDRPLALSPAAARREGAALPPEVFLRVVEAAARTAPHHGVSRAPANADPAGARTGAPAASPPHQGLLTRLFASLRRR
jgi:hypothetical protein